jgi:hypothetical protein
LEELLDFGTGVMKRNGKKILRKKKKKENQVGEKLVQEK